MFKRLPLALILIGATSTWAQQVISAHSGVIHFVEGQVTLDGQPVAPKFAEFPDVKNGQTLAAEDGRAEVLLTPGVILRIAENSSFQMVSNSRSDTRLSILSGSAIVEVGELLASNAITVMYNGAHVELVKRGLYRFDSDPGRLRVYDGEARVTGGSQTLLARKGREVILGAVLDMSGFDVKETDAFMRWASRRSESLAQANISSARSASNLGYSGSSFGSGSGYGYGSGMSSWAYNPYYGMFTYMPYGNSMYYSPFGYPFYSPMNVGYYVPTSGYGGSAFPISTASSTSPHYGSSGSVTMAPRGSYGSTSAASERGSYGSSGLSNGGVSAASSSGGGSMSSGAAAHGGGSSGGGRK